MHSKVYLAAVNGVDAYRVAVEVCAGSGGTLIGMMAANTRQKVMKLPELSVP